MLPMGDFILQAVLDATSRLQRLKVLEADPQRAETERSALRGAIKELKEIIRRNVN